MQLFHVFGQRDVLRKCLAMKCHHHLQKYPGLDHQRKASDIHWMNSSILVSQTRYEITSLGA